MSSDGRTTDTAVIDRDLDPRRWAVLAVLSTVLLLGGLDMTLLNVALPDITRDLGASGPETVWTVNSFSLTLASLLVTMSILGDRFGRKKVFLAGLVVFAAGSGAGALAGSAEALIASRVVQGVGSAAMMATTVALLRVTFTDRRERSVAIGIWTASASAGAALGPVVSGVLLHRFWWGSVFLVNVVLAAAALVAGALLLRDSTAPTRKTVDAVTVISSVAGIGGLVYFLQVSSDERAVTWVSGSVGVVAVGLLVTFVLRQRAMRVPSVDIGMLAERAFGSSTVVVLTSWGSYTALIFVLTQQLQLAEGRSPLAAGLMLIPLAVANSVGAAVSPRIESVLGRSATLLASFVVTAGGLAALAGLGVTTGYWSVIVIGFGIGVVITLGTDVMLGSAPEAKAGEAGAIQETSFSLGSGFGVSVLGGVAALTGAGLGSEVGFRAAVLCAAAGLAIVGIVTWVLLRPVVADTGGAASPS